MKGYIYCITNKATGKKYVGATTNYHKRWSVYKYRLNHNEMHNKDLQDEWNMFGEECFKFTILEEVDITKLPSRKSYYIGKWNLLSNGYNVHTVNQI